MILVFLWNGGRIMYDVLIIGAGICGSFLAYDLSHYNMKVAVVEREHDVANEVTMANSAIIHAGYDPKEGTLKAKLNVQGARMYEQICKDIEADYVKPGALVVAKNEGEIALLKELKEQGDRRGVRSEIVYREALMEIEPNLADGIIAALSVPDTAIIYPWQTAIHLMEHAMLNDVDVFLDHEVMQIKQLEEGYQVITNTDTFTCRCIINAAGLGAAKIAACLGEHPYDITYKRGQYFVLSKLAKGFTNHIVYPVPTSKGKGVLAVPTTHGNTLLGPTAEIIEDEDLSVSSEGLAYVKEHLQTMMKNIPYQEVIRSYSGIRPCGNNGDFYIQESSEHAKFFHVACIDSPGLASAPAISRYVIEELLSKYFTFEKKEEYQKRRPSMICANMSIEERTALIKEQPAFGTMICRCEKISEGEILDVIHRPCGATSIKGIKKRIRPGMGKCQGGFCEVEVAKILARELHIPLCEVLYDQRDTMLGKEVK